MKHLRCLIIGSIILMMGIGLVGAVATIVDLATKYFNPALVAAVVVFLPVAYMLGRVLIEERDYSNHRKGSLTDRD